MQLNGIQEDEGLFENYFIEKLKFQDEYGKTIISDFAHILLSHHE